MMPHVRTATVVLDPRRVVGEIDPRLFGGFVEHLGRAVYGGIYEPGSPYADAHGQRRDVLAALRPLRPTLVRYPGGNFASAYDWRDGVGPVDRRPRRIDPAWQSVEPNAFGTDEFVRWCCTLGTTPYLAVNLGTGTARDAAEWVDYCNVPGGTAASDARIRHGHESPHAVPIWGLGNEMDGPWQTGHCTADQYVARAAVAGRLMKGIDPSIRLVAAGSSGRFLPTYLAWDRTVVDGLWGVADYISAHHYAENPHDDTAAFLAEGVDVDRIIADYDATIGHVAGVRKDRRRMELAFDEWNVWYRARGGDAEKGRYAVAPPLCEEPYDLQDALVVAQYLGAFIRRADLVKIACLAQLVNAIAPITTSPGGVLLRTIYHPLAMIRKSVRGVSLAAWVDAPDVDAGRRPTSSPRVPMLDVAASWDEAGGEIALSLVNRSLDADAVVTVERAGGGSGDPGGVGDVRSCDTLGGGGVAAVKLGNTWDKPARIVPRPGITQVNDGRLTVRVPAPGLTVVRVTTGRA